MKRQGLRTDLTSSQFGTKFRTDEMLAKEMKESRNQIHRYIRLTNLIDALLNLVDVKKVPVNAAVELSYLGTKAQAAGCRISLWMRQLFDSQMRGGGCRWDGTSNGYWQGFFRYPFIFCGCWQRRFLPQRICGRSQTDGYGLHGRLSTALARSWPMYGRCLPDSIRLNKKTVSPSNEIESVIPITFPKNEL